MSGKRRTILFLGKKRQATCTRYRASVFFEYLRQAGYQPALLASDDPGLTPKILHRQVRRASVVVVCRQTFSSALATLLSNTARRLIFDFDDAIFTAPNGPSKGRLRGFVNIVRRCDAVWAGNAYLARAAGRFNPHVSVLPTSVDPLRYEPRHISEANESDRQPLNLVWIGSSATRPYLESALPALASATNSAGEMMLRVVADFDLTTSACKTAVSAKQGSIPGLQTTTGLRTMSVPWSQETEAASIRAAHVGLAPMPANRWTRGKCGLKVLQYMAAGLPVIASDLGVHRRIIIPGRTGFLCRTTEDWVAAIEQLKCDQAMAQRMGQAGRSRLEQFYSRDVVAHRMIHSLQALELPH